MNEDEIREAFEAWAAESYLPDTHDLSRNGVSYNKVLVAMAFAAWKGAIAHSCEGKEELIAALKDCVESLTHLQDRLAVRVNPPTLENAKAALSRHSAKESA